MGRGLRRDTSDPSKEVGRASKREQGEAAEADLAPSGRHPRPCTQLAQTVKSIAPVPVPFLIGFYSWKRLMGELPDSIVHEMIKASLRLVPPTPLPSLLPPISTLLLRFYRARLG